MKKLLALALLFVAATAFSQGLPNDPSFWTTEKKVEVTALAGEITADAFSTQAALHRGFREANPVMRPFVTRGAVGEAVGSALGFGAGIGLAYALHHTGHYKAERITMRVLVVMEGAVVANNFRLLNQ